MNSQATGPQLKKLLAAPDLDAQIDTLLTERFDKGYIAAIDFVLKKLEIDIYHPTEDQKDFYRELYAFTKAKIKPFLQLMKERDTCSLEDDRENERIQRTVFWKTQADKRDRLPYTLSQKDIPTILYTILVYLLNPHLRIARDVFLGESVQKSDLGILMLRSREGPGHAISFFRCNGKEFIDFAQTQFDISSTIYPFSWGLFFDRLSWMFYEKLYLDDIHMLHLTKPIHVTARTGKSFDLPKYNLVYKTPEGRYTFLLNDKFVDFNMDIFEEFKMDKKLILYGLNIIYFIHNDLGRRTFWSGGNRTKRNHKNRKNTRKLKRRQ